MKKNLFSFVSMFLVICMVISSIPVHAITEPSFKLGTSTSTETNLTTSKQEFNAASSSKVLDYVDKAEFESHKFVGRVLEDEELNSYVFQNEDGSRTAYFFSENVKYVDKDGIVQEKDISLTATRSGYSTTKNDVTASFSGSPSEGISIGYDKYSVTLKPIFTTRGVTASQKDNSVEYVGLFNSYTTLKYTPLLSGIKEDIVLTKYTGVNEYSFTLITNGLGVYENANGYFLAKSKATKAIFHLGDVIAYDANLVPYEGTLTVETVKENQEYIITISVDETFLTDKKTVYPVTIDPTITTGDAYNIGAIQDSPIFSARPSSNHGTYEYDRVGTPSAEFGVGRTVIRLYGLINSSTYANLTANRITNVKFYAKEATGSATQTIKVYPLTNTSWTESGVTWNNVGSWSTTAICSVDMAYAQLTAFDITSLVKGWKNGTYAANAGFIMMSANESANKCFVSSEHSDTSRRPYVSMSYTAAISLNTTRVAIDEGGAVAMAVTVNPAGTTVTWSSTNTSVATVNPSGVVTGIKAGTATIKASMTTGGTTYTANCTVYVTIEDGVYYIQNQNSNKYLTTDGTVTGLPNVIQLAKYSEAGNSDAVRIRQMWKIKYLQDGLYSIRPMNKLDMGLDVSEGNVDTCTISTVDQLDHIYIETARWGIVRTDTGIRLSMQGIAGYSLQVQGDSTANNAEIIVDDYMDTDSVYWNLIEIENPPSGAYWYNTNTNSVMGTSTSTKTINCESSSSAESVGIIPIMYSPNSNNQTFTWVSENTEIATVDPNSGLISAQEPGDVVITATSSFGDYKLKLNIRSKSLDPFHYQNIEYIRYVRVTGTNWWGYGNSTDHTISIVKSTMLSDDYCIIHDNIYSGYRRELYINDELKNYLNELENGYASHNISGNVTEEEGAAHSSKRETDQLVTAGYFAYNSSEYYGVWMYNFISSINLYENWKGIIDTTTAIYQVYLTATLFYNSYLASTGNVTMQVNSSQYSNTASSIDDISDALSNINYSDTTIMSAEMRNADINLQYSPYKEGTLVVGFKTTETTQFVRVYTQGVTSPQGSWIMQYSEIQGLTPVQIQNKFSLPNVPTHYCYVNVPSGIQIYTGIASEIEAWGTFGGGVQFELGQIIPGGCFSSGIVLP